MAMRRLGLALALVFALVVPANAQVFKPKSKKSDVSEKKPKKAAKKAAPRAAKKSPAKTAKKKRRNVAAERARPTDLTPEPAARNDDFDYVKITDDDDIE